MKKGVLKKITAAVLSALMLTAPSSAAAFADTFTFGSIGTTVVSSKQNISRGLVYNEAYLVNINSEKLHARVLDFTAGSGTTVKLLWEGALGSADTLDSILDDCDSNRVTLALKDKTDSDGITVVTVTDKATVDAAAAIGLPADSSVGVLIKDGSVVSSSNDMPAVGFKANGAAVIGDPQIKIEAYHGSTHAVSPVYLNKEAFSEGDGIYLFTSDWGDSTGTKIECTEIVMSIESGSLKLGEQTLCKVESANYSSTDAAIPKGCIVVCAKSSFSEYEHLKNTFLAPNIIYVDVSCSTGWADVVTAVTGETMLTENGRLSNLSDDLKKVADQTRIAAGKTLDGSVFFCSFEEDKKSGFSGMTYDEIAQFMLDIGCTESICLVSGGSAGYAVRLPGDNTAQVVSEDAAKSSLRAALVFVNTENASTTPSSIQFSPVNPYVLAGATIDFDTYVLDYTRRVINGLEYNTVYTAAANSGSFSANKYTAPKNAGVYTISANTTAAGVALTSDNTVTVASKLDKLELTVDTGAIVQGAVVPVTVQGYLDSIPVLTSPDQFTYTLASTDPVGYIDDDGFLHVSSTAEGIDTLTVSYGQVSASVTFTVGLTGDVSDGMLHSFEAGPTALDVFSSKKSHETITTDIAVVNGGAEHSARSLYFSYIFPRLTTEETRYILCRYNTKVAVPDDAVGVGMWVKSYTANDGEIKLTVEDKSGNQTDIEYKAVEGITDGIWQYLAADFGGAKYVSLVAPIKVSDSGTESQNGVFYIDNIAFAKSFPEPVADITPDTDSEAAEPKVNVFADSASVAWAESYIEAMYENGFAEGSIAGDGRRYYLPSNNLTREEFAKMLVSFLGINTKLFSGIAFGFTDSDEIAQWAEPYVKAVVSAQLMNGALNDDGTYSFNPKANITRQEVMHVFGKLLDNVSSTATLSFGDSHLIASWAYDNVVRTVTAGIITGDELGNLNPTGNVTRAEIAAIFIRSIGKLTFEADEG